MKQDTELAKMKARAVALLDLLDDIHQRGGGLDDDLLERTTEALNNSQWVDE